LISIVAGVAVVLGLGLSSAQYARDLRLRRAAVDFAGAAGGEKANPDAQLELAPTGDLAIDVAIRAAMGDEDSPLPPNLSPRARDLLLDAAAFRPAWAEHRYLLAIALVGEPKDRTRRALRLAADAAPGVDAVWPALARAELDAWSDLSAAERATAEEPLRNSLRSTRFVKSDFSEIAAAVGVPRAMELLPDHTSALEAAAASLSGLGETAAASRLLIRAEAAERRSRAEDLQNLERRRQLGDQDALRTGCARWFGSHPFGQFDDSRGRGELARLLEIWPEDRRSGWVRNAKLRLLEFFLEGKRLEASPKVLRDTVDSLSSPPPHTAARIALRAGNLEEAEGIARSGAAADGEWGPYLLDLARAEIARGRLEESELALARLPAPFREGCDAALLARQIARGRHDELHQADAERRLAELRVISDGDLASSGSVGICLDPERSSSRVVLRVGAGSPSILAYGWGPSRAATVALSGDPTVLSIPTTGLEGQNALWGAFLSGGPVRSLNVSIQGTP
jgi:hypothetical protein